MPYIIKDDNSTVTQGDIGGNYLLVRVTKQDRGWKKVNRREANKSHISETIIGRGIK